MSVCSENLNNRLLSRALQWAGDLSRGVPCPRPETAGIGSSKKNMRPYKTKGDNGWMEGCSFIHYIKARFCHCGGAEEMQCFVIT